MDEGTSSGDPDAPQVHRRPRLRGVSHAWGFFVSLIAGAALIASATHRLGVVAAAVFAVSLSALLGTSALFHRVRWTSAAGRGLMGRLDHAMIFIFIAGTYTPFTLLGLLGAHSKALLVLSWIVAAVGSVVTMLWYDLPKWVAAALYLVAGWVVVFSLGPLFDGVGAGGFALIIVGGACYTTGAIVFARRRPDPVPMVFGYHEVFHLLVLAGAASHFAAVALVVPI